MVRMRMVGLLLCALLCLTSVVPAYPQGAVAHVTQAQQTLTEIVRLLDAVQARQKALVGNRNTAGLAATEADDWTPLFDGSSLLGWKPTNFSGAGKVHIEQNYRGGPPAIIVDAGSQLSGITWTNDVPKTRYEVSLEAMKIEGADFMCGLTFPVGDSYASLILGGWGGSVVGISSINNLDASENETTRYLSFPKDRWFAIRLRVTPAKIEAWLDASKIVDEKITGKKISLRFGEIDRSIPLGLATYQTTSAFRTIKLRRLDAQ